jgi:hypothetical protein
METETSPKRARILEIAWQRYADLDLAADRRAKEFYTMRRWIIWLAVLATLFAILAQQFFPNSDIQDPPFQGYFILSLVVKVLFITISLLATILVALSARDYSDSSRLFYRAGAEEIKKEIYLYRTVRKNDPRRYQILRRRLAQIQKQLSRSLKEVFSFERYDGPLPPFYHPNAPDSDPGFQDLNGDEYLNYRLSRQLNWHNNRVNYYKVELRWFTIYILALAGLGSLLVAWGGPLGIWTAFTGSLTLAILNWQSLRNLDSILPYYSKVTSDLTLLYDWWQNLELEERTEKNFHKLVMECEKVLWAQNMEYTRLMQEVDTDTDTEEERPLLEDVINEAISTTEYTN